MILPSASHATVPSDIISKGVTNWYEESMVFIVNSDLIIKIIS